MNKPKKLKVTPLTKKMKERVRLHGEVWETDDDSIGPGSEISIRTTVMAHRAGEQQYPYSRWIKVGVDCHVEEA